MRLSCASTDIIGFALADFALHMTTRSNAGLEDASPRFAENRLSILLLFWKLKHFQVWKGVQRLEAIQVHHPLARAAVAAGVEQVELAE